MKTALEYIKIGFKEELIYRSSIIWGLLTSVLAMFVQIKFWQVLISASAISDGRSIGQYVVFIVINSVVSMLTGTRAAYMIEQYINDGTISCALTIPATLKKQILFHDFGGNLNVLLFTVLPPAIIMALIYGFSLPDLKNGLLFVVSVTLGALISFEVKYIIGLTAFFLITIWFSDFFLQGFMTLFGASAIPLWFYPDWLAKVSLFLPFRYISYEPILIFLGESESPLTAIILQLAWLAVLFLIEKLVWRRAERKLIVQGG